LRYLLLNMLVGLISLLAMITPASAQSRPPIIVLTDMGGDPDDEQTMTRLLHYANDVDIRGLIATRTVKHGVATVRKDKILALIDAYEVDRPYLAQHDSRFPSAAQLRGLTKAGSTSGTVGAHTEGSVHIYNVVKAAADAGSEPVWVLIWGGPRELAQALAQARSSLSSDGYARFKQKLRVYAIAQQYEPEVGVRIIRDNPDLFYIVAGPPGITDGMRRIFRGIYKTLDERTHLNETWIRANLWNGHGALARRYPGNVNLGGYRANAVKEGDTPSLLHVLPLGLNDPEQPEQGGWGGRFYRTLDRTSGLTFWNDISVADTVWHNGANVMDRRIAVARWRQQFQNDFAARADWAVRSYADANHAPVAASNHPEAITVRSGTTVTLDASSSSDPDGDALSFNWWIYDEVGTYPGAVSIANSRSRIASLVAPRVSAPATLHVILEVQDGGSPRLTRYQRVVMTVVP
jgi:hypothetical protein